MRWSQVLASRRGDRLNSRRILDGRVELSTCGGTDHGHARALLPRWRQPVFVLLLLLTAPMARAELTVYGGVEYFDWRESTTPSVTETGPLALGGLIWMQDRERGLVFGYRGEIYAGSVNYSGADLFTGAPLQSTTQYAGLLNEGQVRYRIPASASQHVDAMVSVGADIWRRQLSSDQMEDWAVFYARFGVELGPSVGKAGWIGSAGLKYPFYVYENAHLTDIGFDQNPTIQPGGSWSGYASFGYRFGGHWSVVGFYDSYRFQQSPTAQVTSGGATYYVYQPKSSLDVFGVTVLYSF
jgi:hypothetical protein